MKKKKKKKNKKKKKKKKKNSYVLYRIQVNLPNNNCIFYMYRMYDNI